MRSLYQTDQRQALKPASQILNNDSNNNNNNNLITRQTTTNKNEKDNENKKKNNNNDDDIKPKHTINSGETNKRYMNTQPKATNK